MFQACGGFIDIGYIMVIIFAKYSLSIFQSGMIHHVHALHLLCSWKSNSSQSGWYHINTTYELTGIHPGSDLPRPPVHDGGPDAHIIWGLLRWPGKAIPIRILSPAIITDIDDQGVLCHSPRIELIH